MICVNTNTTYSIIKFSNNLTIANTQISLTNEVKSLVVIFDDKLTLNPSNIAKLKMSIFNYIV